MENFKQIENCMKRQCEFCRRKTKCDKQIKEDKKYGVKPRTSKWNNSSI